MAVTFLYVTLHFLVDKKISLVLTLTVFTLKKTFVLFKVGFNNRSGLSELTNHKLIEIEC